MKYAASAMHAMRSSKLCGALYDCMQREPAVYIVGFDTLRGAACGANRSSISTASCA
jgi:hypothetical protein